MADKQANQTFSFEIVSCLLAALSESGATVGAKHYAMMAKIDGTKSQSGYEHMFRAVKARAKEINQQNANGGGENGTPVKKTKSAASTPASKRKRGKKAAGEDEGDDAELDTKKTKVKEEKNDDSGDEL